jgi:hypothetical protein
MPGRRFDRRYRQMMAILLLHRSSGAITLEAGSADE